MKKFTKQKRIKLFAKIAVLAVAVGIAINVLPATYAQRDDIPYAPCEDRYLVLCGRTPGMIILDRRGNQLRCPDFIPNPDFPLVRRAPMYICPEAASAFDVLRDEVITAIDDVGLPNVEAFLTDGYSVVVPGMEIIERVRLSSNPDAAAPNLSAIYDPYMIPFTYWDTLGIPAIASEWGSRDATGIYALVDQLIALAEAEGRDWTLETDDDPSLANFAAFALLHAPMARAGTPVYTNLVNIVSVHADTQRTQENDPDPSFDSTLDYRVFLAAIEVGEGPLNELRIANILPDAGPSGGPGQPILAPWDGIRAQVFDFDFNYQGVVVGFRSIRTDNPQHFVPTYIDGVRHIRIGDYLNTYFPVAPDAKFYWVSTGATAVQDIRQMDWAELEPSISQHIRVVFCENFETIIEVYISAGTRAALPANIDGVRRFTYHLGVVPHDARFGFNERENPHPISYSLFDPTRFPEETGATDPDGRYPLFIYFHGLGGGANMNTFSNFGIPFTFEGRQREFENENPALSGAFIMNMRGNQFASSSLGQDWMHGNRSYTNPMWAAGYEAYRARPTNVAAIVANVQRLIADNPNIDPNRIYLTGISAGAYMAFFTLLEAPDLFAGGMFVVPAFFPHDDARPYMDASMFFEGSDFAERFMAVMHIPMWWTSHPNDPITPFYYTTQAEFPTAIYGQYAINALINAFRESPNGNSLTRVDVNNRQRNAAGNIVMGHSGNQLADNNRFNDDVVRDGIQLRYMSQIFGERPADWVPHPPSMSTAPTPQDANIYSYGTCSVYSTQEPWLGSMIEWFNAAAAGRDYNPRTAE
ncbi:MAG: prolyl oligopeptidase family serine peptidase [Turicibacter sp.]|nr:prolyl oligopeptidase family serine peptidase [Turicibacter sp.]